MAVVCLVVTAVIAVVVWVVVVCGFGGAHDGRGCVLGHHEVVHDTGVAVVRQKLQHTKDTHIFRVDKVEICIFRESDICAYTTYETGKPLLCLFTPIVHFIFILSFRSFLFV